MFFIMQNVFTVPTMQPGCHVKLLCASHENTLAKDAIHLSYIQCDTIMSTC